MLSIILAVIGGFVGLLMYLWFNAPIPEGYQNANKIRGFHIVLRLLHFWAKGWGAVTGKSYLALFASFEKTAIKYQTVPCPEHIKVEDTVISGVKARVYAPGAKAPGLSPGYIYIHGGGWAVASVDMYNRVCYKLCEALNAVVISVEYRLAREDTGLRYPIPFDDCYNVAQQILTHAEDYGMDRSKVVIGGDSAGGNLSAAVCLKLRDEKVQPQPRLQVLVYPCLQPLDLNLPSYQQNRSALGLSRWLMATFWSTYITGNASLTDALIENAHVPEEMEEFLDHNGLSRRFFYKPYKPRSAASSWPAGMGEHAKVLLDPYLAPLLAPNLSGLPEAYVFSAHHDVLRDDALLYVRRLREAGVQVTLDHCEHGYHGLFALVGELREADAALQQLTDFVSSKLTQ